jgi:hypothetical protein
VPKPAAKTSKVGESVELEVITGCKG